MESFRRKSFFFLSAVCLLGLAVHTPVTVWLSVYVPSIALVAKSWKEMCLLLLFLLLIWHITAHRSWGRVLGDRLIQLILANALIVGCVSVFVPTDSITALLAGLQIDLRGFFAFSIFYIASKLFWDDLRQWLLRCAAITTGFIASFTLIQLFLPRDFLRVLGYGHSTIEPYMTVDKAPWLTRQNATLRGPNPLGAYAAASLLVVAAYWHHAKALLQNKWIRYCFSIMTLGLIVGLIVSYSRSAWLGFGAGVMIMIAMWLRRAISVRTWIIICIVLCAGLGGLFALRENTFVSTVFFHDNPEGSVTKSNDEHARSLLHAFDRVSERPFGHGVGSAGSASLYGSHPVIVENQYLFVGYELGWLGMIGFIATFGVIIYVLIRRQDWLARAIGVAGICLAIIGLMLPVFADDVIVLVWWSIAGVVLGGATIKHNERPQSPHKKTARNA